jgi:hypothetical protein
MITIRALAVCLAALAAGPALADVWDVQSDNDNSQTTDNELIHGSLQLHDLGALAGPTADQDWYLVGQAPKASYELIVDGISGDVGDKGLSVTRLSSALTVVQASVPITVGLDYARSLRWENTGATPVNNEFIRIQSTLCGTDCGADDTYRVRLYETTFAIPRYNVSTTQTTVLLIQNPTGYQVTGRAHFWNSGGTLMHTTPPFTLEPKALFNLNLATVSQLTNTNGSITVSHNARYGDLAGKAVALEPATGFSFDTPMLWRPR